MAAMIRGMTLLLLVWAAVGSATEVDPDEALRQLASSVDGGVLLKAAVSVASRGNEAALLELAKHLRDKEWLDLFKSPDASDPLAHLWPMKAFGRIFEAAAARPEPEVRAFFVSLLEHRAPQEHFHRDNELFGALYQVRPVSKEMIEALERHGDEETGTCLLANWGTKEAYAIIERRLRERARTNDALGTIMANRAVKYRDNPNAMHMWLALLAEKSLLPKETAELVVRRIFTYCERDWPPDVRLPRPPPWDKVSRESLEVIAKIADLAATMDIPPELKETVGKSKTDIEAVLRLAAPSAGQTGQAVQTQP